VISPTRIEKTGVPGRKRVRAKVHRIDWPTSDVTIIHLRFPTGVRVPFRAGQYLRIMLSDGSSRNYSMANAPSECDGAQLHVKRIPGGLFSDVAVASLEVGSSLEVELPYGEFTMDPDGAAKAILMATGTGFAPFKSLIENQIRRGRTRPMHLYWGARTETTLYLPSLAERWTRHSWFTFTPVLSSPSPAWAGRHGYVQDAVLADYPDLSAVEVFACGSTSMIDCARNVLVPQGGLCTESFHSDAFVPSGETTAAEPASSDPRDVTISRPVAHTS
jgi:CDP-4-dehydro-6-deoxyglucose reductase/3-phenylpropionate/trans-cinnamate dioxygenase ferredoxin reductase subunit